MARTNFLFVSLCLVPLGTTGCVSQGVFVQKDSPLEASIDGTLTERKGPEAERQAEHGETEAEAEVESAGEADSEELSSQSVIDWFKKGASMHPFPGEMSPQITSRSALFSPPGAKKAKRGLVPVNLLV